MVPVVPPSKPTVAILGGGVGGLSAAHELAERGFAVTVYERQATFGGKARSMSVPGSGTGGRKDLPGEHGFRFFPGFYKHITDTMRRIPFHGSGTCADNLVLAPRILLARAGKAGRLVHQVVVVVESATARDLTQARRWSLGDAHDGCVLTGIDADGHRSVVLLAPGATFAYLLLTPTWLGKRIADATCDSWSRS